LSLFCFEYFSRDEEYIGTLQAAKVLKPAGAEWLAGGEGSASCLLENGEREKPSGQSKPNSQNNCEQADCVGSTATTNGGSGGRGGAKV